MKQKTRWLALLLAVVMAASLCGCGSKASTGDQSVSDNYTQDSAALTLDNTKWNYDTNNDVYWQIGVQYCAAPQNTTYETMGIYVPGAYMTGTENSDGTYTCTVNADGSAGSYTAATAPIVIPVNTPGYAASAAPTEYSYSSEIASCLEAGFIYVQPGIRGRITSMGGSQTTETSASSDDTASGGAPWGVADIKAAIRYYRFNADSLPGSTDSIFSFGMSGGGAQSALVGATGDSELYTPYLETIGAAMTDADGNALSDAVCGSMCWCPITSLDYADEAYEWNMGQFASSDARADDSFGSQLSQDMAAAFADYINALGLKDGDTALTLEKSDSGIYQSGSYYDYILSVINTSLNNFLSDTTFPYTETSTASYPGGNNGTFGRDGTSGTNNGSAQMPTSGQMPTGGQMPDGAAAQSNDSASSGTTYETAQDYIDSLNSDGEWITYDSATNTAKVASVEAFVEHCKNASKSIGAFDEIDRGQGENSLFGDGVTTSLHFDATLAALLKDNADAYAKYSDWDASYVTDYASDLAETDSLGTSMQTRLNMYNPMYYLSGYYDGYQSSTVAKYWRIRTGIDQSDTALTVETNLALALQNDSTVSSVDFATVWGQGHTMAERSGNSTTNFIAWVNECLAH